MSGWQLSGDAPTAYTRYAPNISAPWTDDLITQGQCKTGDRVLDIACGTGIVASSINLVSKAECKIVVIDVNEGRLNMAERILRSNGTWAARLWPSAFADFVGERLKGYVDDAGLAAPMENHFLMAIR